MANFRAWTLAALSSFLVVFACSDDGDGEDNNVPTAPAGRDGGGTKSDSGTSTSGGTDSGGTRRDSGPLGKGNLRVLAGNITSGGNQKYDTGEGMRLFKGLNPDIALVQEMNYKTNSEGDIAEFVSTAFGDGYQHFRESGAGIQIPNGVVSRFPIASSGQWTDPEVANRSFAWAKITVPGSHPLWAVSVHLLTSSGTARNAEAAALVAELKNVVAEGDYIIIGGDFNTDSRNETCLTTFAELMDTAGPIPADAKGNNNTNAPRSKPYDWVLANNALSTRQVPTTIGANTFDTGLVFDSRIYTPLEDVPPIQANDSAATNMQHMPVVKDFSLPN